MSSPDTPPPNELGQVLVNFSELGAYPDDESTSAALVEDSVLLGALEILQNAKDELEVCIIPNKSFARLTLCVCTGRDQADQSRECARC